MAFHALADYQNHVIGWLQWEQSSLGDGAVVRFPRIWMSSGERRFILVRVGFGNALVSRAGGKVERLRSGFSENAFSYLLFLRLVPIFPFWLVNLAAALLSVPLRTFALTTAVGIIPGSSIFASFGGGVGAILDDGGPIDLANVLTPSVALPIAALSASAGAHAISKIEPQQGNFPALEPEVARRPRWRPQGSLKPT